MQLLSHPFRLEADGSAATVTDGTPDATAEGVAVMVLTHAGERPLVPEFGITDPTYGELDVAELEVKLDTYGPAVKVTEFDVTYPSDGVARVVLTFDDGED